MCYPRWVVLGHSLVSELQAVSKSLLEILMGRNFLQDMWMFADMLSQTFVAFRINKVPTIPNDNLSVSEPRVVLTQAFGKQVHVVLEVDRLEGISLLPKVLIAELRYRITSASGDIGMLEASESE